MLPDSSELSARSTQVLISMCSPRLTAPSSSTPGDLAEEADAARAVDAAGHVGRDQRPQILVGDRPLVLREARMVGPVEQGQVLQVALAALVADRAVERMVDQQELEHALARLVHRRRVGLDHHALGHRHARRTPAAWAIFSISTRHIRQLPAMLRRGWKQNTGISRPAASQACSTVEPGGTSTSCPSIVSFGMHRSLARVRNGITPRRRVSCV